MKVSELEGNLLDYWVARALGCEPYYPAGHPEHMEHLRVGSHNSRTLPKYSTDWAQGGPIIERYRIGLYDGAIWDKPIADGGVAPIPMWRSAVNGSPNYGSSFDDESEGPAPLIAAMRAFVASVYGEEVPEVAQ